MRRLLRFLHEAVLEFMFFLTDDENGTWCGAYDSLSCATDAQMPPTGVAVSRDHDKIDVQIFGRLGDLVGRVPSSRGPRERTRIRLNSKEEPCERADN